MYKKVYEVFYIPDNELKNLGTYYGYTELDAVERAIKDNREIFRVINGSSCSFVAQVLSGPRVYTGKEIEKETDIDFRRDFHAE